MSFFSLRTWQLGIKSLLLHPLRSLLDGAGDLHRRGQRDLAVGHRRGDQPQGPGADRGPGGQQHHRPLDQAAERGDRNSPAGSCPTASRATTSSGSSTRSPRSTRALPIREIRQRFGFAAGLVDGRLVGCTPEYAEVTRLEVDRGRFLTDVEVHEKQNHCVLAAEVAERLFPFEDPHRPLHPRRRGVLRGGRRDEAADRHGGDRRLAGRPGFLQRRLHPHRHAAEPHRRPRGHPALRLLRGRDRRAQPDHAPHRQSGERAGNGRPGRRNAASRANPSHRPRLRRHRVPWNCWNRPAPRG